MVMELLPFKYVAICFSSSVVLQTSNNFVSNFSFGNCSEKSFTNIKTKSENETKNVNFQMHYH